MGTMNAMGFAEAVNDGTIGLRTAVSWHLSSNHYPPVHADFLPVALEAIARANEGDWESTIDMPNGLTRSVGQIVEGLHLDAFLTPDEDEFGVVWDDDDDLDDDDKDDDLS